MSKIEVDAIDKQSGSTLTLGGSGTAVTLASGATQTGFGRTGTVDWQTGSIKTSTFTAANGEGYFANTSGGAFTMNLPAGTAGNIVSVVDYTNTFQTNNLTIAPNGSQKIGGVAASDNLSTEGQSVTFVYVDDTEGWKNVQDSTSNVTGNPFLIASGGTETTSGNCKIHTFTGPGTFTVAAASTNCAAENIVSYMVVAGGGAGGTNHGAGAGGGGFREIKSPSTPYTASPLDGYATPANRITVTAQAYTITVGAGGAGTPNCSVANSGNPSTFSTITSAGGGKAGTGNTPFRDGGNGGSGGAGSSGPSTTIGSAGTGNTPPVSPAQGTNGGTGGTDNASWRSGGSGGGATTAGGSTPPGPSSPGPSAAGGAGATTNISGSPLGYSGGGGSGGSFQGGGASSCGSGLAGQANTDNGGSPTMSNAAANRGGGGGGAGSNQPTGSSGGSGIVIIRYKFQ